MRAELHSSVIAIDGGGTRCRIVLDGPEGRFLVERGPANVSSDFNAATREIEAGLAALAEQTGKSLADIRDLPIYLGLAGLTAQKDGAARVIARLQLRRARATDDRPSALRGALGDCDGVIAHLGTGSFFALRRQKQVRLAGGWGARLGDEASAFWVARSALSATLDAEDRLIETTDLTRALMKEFGSAGSIVAHAAQATPAEIGDLAPLVTAAAASGDPVGLRILNAGADHIASIVARMGWQAGMALCLTGGLGPVYRDFLPADLAPALVAPRAAPIEGALDLARDFAAELNG